MARSLVDESVFPAAPGTAATAGTQRTETSAALTAAVSFSASPELTSQTAGIKKSLTSLERVTSAVSGEVSEKKLSKTLKSLQDKIQGFLVSLAQENYDKTKRLPPPQKRANLDLLNTVLEDLLCCTVTVTPPSASIDNNSEEGSDCKKALQKQYAKEDHAINKALSTSLSPLRKQTITIAIQAAFQFLAMVPTEQFPSSEFTRFMNLFLISGVVAQAELNG
jgi:hypothetical protein